MFIHVNGCRPEFHPACLLRQTRVTPHDLVLIGRMSTAFWSMDSRVGWSSISTPEVLDLARKTYQNIRKKKEQGVKEKRQKRREAETKRHYQSWLLGLHLGRTDG